MRYTIDKAQNGFVLRVQWSNGRMTARWYATRRGALVALSNFERTAR